MQRKAQVISVDGRIATVKSERSSMCDGCQGNTCGSSCAAGMIMGSDKSMTAKACNDIGARVGDTVEIETSDGKVLSYALLVFILPIFVCAVLYSITSRYFTGDKTPLLIAAAGFALTFLIVGTVEKLKSKSEPDIVITRIIRSDTEFEN